MEPAGRNKNEEARTYLEIRECSLHPLAWSGSVVNQHYEFLDDSSALGMLDYRSSGNYMVEHDRAFRYIFDTLKKIPSSMSMRAFGITTICIFLLYRPLYGRACRTFEVIPH